MTDLERLLEANDMFYAYMRHGDLPGMAELWARKRLITCTHPGRQMQIGREAVMEGWRRLLTGAPPSIWPDEPRPIIAGNSAFVLTIERVGASELMASNGFVKEDGQWRMINHQAAAIPAESPT